MKSRMILGLVLLLTASSCSIRKFATNMMANAVSSSGPSPLERNKDVELVTFAIPAFITFYEGMLEEVPKHKGLLTQLSQAYTSFAYLGVQQNLDRAKDTDYRLADHLRARVKWLYLRGNEYGLRGLEASHRGFAAKFATKPSEAVKVLNKRDLQLMYWTAASLGLAISSGRDDAAMIARIPEVDALIERGLELDETWRDGAFHEFAIILASAKPGRVDYEAVSRHYQRTVDLSRGKSASIHVTYAEAVSVPRQQPAEFREMLERALVPDPEEPVDLRLTNELARRRADWLLGRIDDLILNPDSAKEER
jgi:TRAP transporter TatT component family protein